MRRRGRPLPIKLVEKYSVRIYEYLRRLHNEEPFTKLLYVRVPRFAAYNEKMIFHNMLIMIMMMKMSTPYPAPL